MEELVEKFNDGEDAVILLNIESITKFSYYETNIKTITKLCPRVSVICLYNSMSHESVPSSNHIIFLDLTYHTRSLYMEYLLEHTKLIFLVNMSLCVFTEGKYSSISECILSNLLKDSTDVYCLHSVENLCAIFNTGGLTYKHSDEKDLLYLRSHLKDISIVHMIGEPTQVLSLMTWGLNNLNSLKYGTMMNTKPEPRVLPHTETNALDKASIDRVEREHTLINMSEIFAPLFASTFATARIEEESHSGSVSEVREEGEWSRFSPHARFSPHQSGNSDTHVDINDDNDVPLLTLLPDAAEKPRPRARKRQAAEPLHPPRHPRTQKYGSFLPGRVDMHDENSLESTDSRVTGVPVEESSQSSMATLADIAVHVSSTPERPFQHIFASTKNLISSPQRGTTSATQLYSQESDGEGSFPPLSQISALTGDIDGMSELERTSSTVSQGKELNRKFSFLSGFSQDSV